VNLPLPHTSFPQGDTIPLTVTVLTGAQGSPWSAADHYRIEIGQASLRCEISGPTGQAYLLYLQPVPGRRARYAATLFTESLPGGLYRYAVRLILSSSPPQRYTLLRGTFSLL